jgi:hypothetical protein
MARCLLLSAGVRRVWHFKRLGDRTMRGSLPPRGWLPSPEILTCRRSGTEVWAPCSGWRYHLCPAAKALYGLAAKRPGPTCPERRAQSALVLFRRHRGRHRLDGPPGSRWPAAFCTSFALPIAPPRRGGFPSRAPADPTSSTRPCSGRTGDAIDGSQIDRQILVWKSGRPR